MISSLEVPVSFVCTSSFAGQLLLAICSDMVFVSCVYTVGHMLTAWQRLALGILPCNSQLGFMLLVSYGLESIDAGLLAPCCAAFIALIFALTLAFVRMFDRTL